jgi:hypothetical protein
LLCYQKFPLLVTLSLGGTLYYRDERKNGALPLKEDFYVKGRKIYLRPGYKEFLSRLMKHPRIKLAFYTSMKWKNV